MSILTESWAKRTTKQPHCWFVLRARCFKHVTSYHMCKRQLVWYLSTVLQRWSPISLILSDQTFFLTLKIYYLSLLSWCWQWHEPENQVSCGVITQRNVRYSAMHCFSPGLGRVGWAECTMTSYCLWLMLRLLDAYPLLNQSTCVLPALSHSNMLRVGEETLHPWGCRQVGV